MQKEKIRPDEYTFIIILNSCSHAGLVEEAIYYFSSMESEFNIKPNIKHYTCIVDTLGRAGKLEEAEKFIETIPLPDIITWKALLGACRIYNDIERAERIAQKAFSLDTKDCSTYVLLSNIYASKGRFQDVNKIRELMKQRGIKKIPGQTWIEINGKVHSFLVHDKSHESTKEIYEELEKLNKQMKVAGYIPNTNFILHDVEEEEKEQLLCYHSEKLALSFGIINTPPNSSLTIVKNLRICGDCHNATKYISKLQQREIIVRDSNRFHHFKNGTCSCNDYY